MNIGIGLLVFFVSLIALVAEFILYFILGIGVAFSSGGASATSSLVFFFIGLMVFTGAVGILYPICAILATITKNPKLCNSIFVGLLCLILIGYGSFFSLGTYPKKSRAAETSRPAAVPAESKAAKVVIAENKEIPESEPTPAQQTNSAEQDYIRQYLVLKNVKVGEGYGKYDIPEYSTAKKGIFGTIKNTGDKTINYLELTIYFLDFAGLRVGEKPATVISTENIFDPTPAMKPNYSKDFGFIIQEDAPSEWAGKAEVEITKIKFAEN